MGIKWPKTTDGRRPPRPHGEKRSPQLMATVLEVLATGKSPTAAAAAVGVDRSTLYNWRDADEAFAKAWEDAVDQGIDKLEDEALRRATEGVLKPVFQGGEEVGAVREFSDTLMILMMKGRRPNRYRDSVAVSGPDGGAIPHKIEVEFVDVTKKDKK